MIACYQTRNEGVFQSRELGELRNGASREMGESRGWVSRGNAGRCEAVVQLVLIRGYPRVHSSIISREVALQTIMLGALLQWEAGLAGELGVPGGSKHAEGDLSTSSQHRTTPDSSMIQFSQASAMSQRQKALEWLIVRCCR